MAFVFCLFLFSRHYLSSLVFCFFHFPHSSLLFFSHTFDIFLLFFKNILLTTPFSLSASFYTLLFFSFPHLLKSSFEQLIPPTNSSFTTILPFLHSVFSSVAYFPLSSFNNSLFLLVPTLSCTYIIAPLSLHTYFSTSHYYLILSPDYTGC